MGESIRVALFDDDPTFSTAASRALNRGENGIVVEPFTEFDGVTDRLDADNFDCVVTEYNVNSTPASSLARMVSSRDRSIPVILLSDGSFESIGDEAQLFAELVPKLHTPTGFELLATRITHAVRTRQSASVSTGHVDRLESLIENLPGIAYRSEAEHPWPMDSVYGDCRGLTGYDATALIEGDLEYGRDIIHREDREHVITATEDGLEDGGRFEIRYRIVTADGSTRWVYESGRRVVTGDPSTERLEGFITDITGWHHHRERQRVLFEDAADAIVEVRFDNDTAVIDRINPAFESVFGISAFEVEDRPVNDVIVPPAKQEHAAAIDREVANGEIVEEELKRQTANGERWFLLRTVPFTLGDERRAYATYVDITAQKEREHAIESLHSATRSMFEQTSERAIHEAAVQAATDVLGLDVAISLTLDGARDRLVAQADAPTSLSMPAPIDTGEDDLLHPVVGTDTPLTVDGAELASRLDLAASDDASGLIVPVGDWGVIAATTESSQPIDAPKRRLAGLLGSATASALDAARREAQLTELHRAASTIGATDTHESIYERLIMAAEEILEFDFAVVDVREGDQLVTVETSHAIEDAAFFDRTPVDATDNLAAAVYRSGEPDLTADLTTLDVVPADPTFRSALTVPIGSYGLIQAAAKREGAFDETDLEFVELLVSHAREALTRLDRTTELEARTTELNRQNERLEQFAELVSHDLRNPLSVITGRLELARNDPDGGHLQAIDDALDRMESIIEHTLALAREGQTVGETEPVELDELATECWSRVETDEATLSIDAPITFAADRERVKHVLENLFRNAIEHVNEAPTIRVGPLDEGFFVADDGPGIPPDNRQTIFETGYSTGEDGIGLGLAIAEEIAEAHGWRIEVTDSWAGGARFEITDVDVCE